MKLIFRLNNIGNLYIEYINSDEKIQIKIKNILTDDSQNMKYFYI